MPCPLACAAGFFTFGAPMFAGGADTGGGMIGVALFTGFLGVARHGVTGAVRAALPLERDRVVEGDVDCTGGGMVRAGARVAGFDFAAAAGSGAAGGASGAGVAPAARAGSVAIRRAQSMNTGRRVQRLLIALSYIRTVGLPSWFSTPEPPDRSALMGRQVPRLLSLGEGEATSYSYHVIEGSSGLSGAGP